MATDSMCYVTVWKQKRSKKIRRKCSEVPSNCHLKSDGATRHRKKFVEN